MDGPLGKPEDRCPICGNTAQNTPGIRFKINTKCYHRICETCVDRHFSSGKANCPVAGCQKHLWKREWRTQTFEDLQIEKEVEIRKRVNKILDRREEEFEGKREFDDFLELREETVMNLLLNTDVAITNRKLKEYQIANGLKIDKDAEEAASDPKSKAARRKDNHELADPSGFIKGLKKIVAPKPRTPYDPFMGMATKMDYFESQDDCESGYDQYQTNEALLAGGFDLRQTLEESLLRAFAGLGVFIDEEMSGETNPSLKPERAIPSTAADDVF